MSLDGLTHPPAASPPDETQLTILQRIDANVGLLGSAINDVKARVSVLETWKNEVAAGVHADPFPAPVPSAPPAPMPPPPRPMSPSFTTEVKDSMRAQSIDIGAIKKMTSTQTIADCIKVGAIAGGVIWAIWTQVHPTPPQVPLSPTPVVIVDAGSHEGKTP